MAGIRDGQSPEYRKLREELLVAENELIERRERVAALRRALPLGAPVATSYVFREGPADLERNSEGDFFDTSLAECFGPDHDELVVEHMMFAPSAERGCPMCSMWIDGLDGVAHHLADRLAYVVIAAAPIQKLRAWGRARGWRRVRLLSSHGTPFTRDFGVEIDEDRQLPGLSVFTRDAAGTIFHRYTTEGSLVDRHHRAMDLLSPVWNTLDLVPGGRGDWMPKHFYE